MVFRYVKYLALITFVLLFYIWQQTESVRLGYKVDNLKKECERWEQENISLELKVNQFMSMERLDQVAKQKGLIHPQEKDIIYLEND
jgi:cell division protein FtsL